MLDRSFPLGILETRRVHFSLELDIRVRLVSGSYRVERVAGRIDRRHVDIVPRPILLSLLPARVLEFHDRPIDLDLVGQLVIRFVVGALTKAFLELQQISEKRLAFAAEQTCSETIPRVYRSCERFHVQINDDTCFPRSAVSSPACSPCPSAPSSTPSPSSDASSTPSLSFVELWRSNLPLAYRDSSLD